MAGRPLVAAALLFLAGAALGAWLPQHPGAWTAAAAAALAGWGFALARRLDRAGTRAGVVALLLVGVARSQGDLVDLHAGADPVPEGEAVVSGRVGATPQRRGGDQVIHLEDARLRRDGATVSARGPVQLILEGGGERHRVGERLLARGRVVAARGDRTLGWFPAPAVPRERRLAARVIVGSPAWVRREGEERQRGPGAAVLRWREAATRHWQGAPGQAAAILDALTTGERAAVAPGTQEAFLRSGLTHLLAISGMNVAFLAALVYLLLRRALASWEFLALRRPVHPVAALLTAPFLWFFYRFSGSQIPVGRATVMAAAGMAAVVIWRRIDAGDAAAFAAVFFVARDPRSLFSPSFQLSFAAVAALVLVAPRLASAPEEREGEGRARRCGRQARALLVVSLAAGAATAPLVAYHFQQFSLVGPVANLVAVPFTGLLVLPAAWLALIGHALWPPAGELLRVAAAALADGLVGIAGFFAAPAWASLRVPRPPALPTLALLVLAATCVHPATSALRRLRLAAAAGAAVACALWWLALQRPELRVVFVDVGQGLAAAVLPPGGEPLLVDAGPRWREGDAGDRIVAPALRKLGVTRLAALALTHDHPDHAGGAASLLAQVPTRRIWRGAADPRLPGGGADLPGLALRRDPRVEQLGRGDRRDLGGGARLVVLNPARAGAEAGGRRGDANDRSLAFLLSWRDVSLLVTGDIGPAAAREVVAAARGPAAGPSAGAIALQVPHHGGSPEACRTLADGFRPSVAVVSVGRNGYGHPRAAAVATLEAGGRVLRTDRDGGVFLASDGRVFTVRSWREMAGGRSWAERWRWLVAGW